jgi:hypothetical protein
MKIIETEDPGSFYCPITGQMLFNKYDSEESDAVEFAYLWDISEFVLIKPEYEALYAACEEEENENSNEQRCAYEIFLDKLKDKEDFVLFSFTSSGMACGPVSSTVDYCINMAYKAD